MECDVMQNRWSVLTGEEGGRHLFSEVCELICLCNRKRNVLQRIGGRVFPGRRTRRHTFACLPYRTKVKGAGHPGEEEFELSSES